MSNDKLDLDTITLIDHTAMDEDNWEDYSITVDASTIEPFSLDSVMTTGDNFTFDFDNLDLSMNSNNNMDGKLTLSGEGADIVINGKSLADTIENIEQRLNILKVNPELEAQWKELEDLGKQYRALEANLLEKNKLWNKLNSAEGD